MRPDVEVWRDAFDEMYRLTVSPRRSVNRIRRAIAAGIDPADFLKDIEEGLQACVDLTNRMDDCPPVCPLCLGSGHADSSSEPSGESP